MLLFFGFFFFFFFFVFFFFCLFVFTPTVSDAQFSAIFYTFGQVPQLYLEIDHEIFSTVILSLPLIQEGQLSVSGERMCTILVNRLED